MARAVTTVANVTVTIRSNEDIRYSPSAVVRPGDLVLFKLENVPYSAELSFDEDDCFVASGPFELNGNSLTLSSTLQTVTMTVAPGPYPFTVHIYDGTKDRKKGGELETKKGGLEVTTDPPK